MTVLVTGGTGFIGSHVVEVLLNRKHSVRCLVRKSSNLQWLENLPVELVTGDFNNVESLKNAVTGIDIIIHIAGVVAAKNREGFFGGNLTATTNLLTAIVKYNPDLKRFLHVSSQTAVGPGKNGKPVDETTPPNPITTYGESKLAAEEAVLSYSDKIPVTIVRPPAVYGPRDTATLSFFQSVNKGLIPLVGFSPKRVSLVHAYDLARGIVDAALSENTKGKIYFVGSEDIYDWKQIGDVTADAVGRKTLKLPIPEFFVMGIAGLSGFISKFKKKPSVLNYEKGKDMIADNWTCSIQAAKKDFGYRQEVSLEEGIKNTLDWYRQHGWL
jgi:dihydroflavonol-4-reductase